MQALALESLIGKPIVAFKDGKRREVGTITAAIFKNDHLQIAAGVTDEELLKTLNNQTREGISIGG